MDRGICGNHGRVPGYKEKGYTGRVFAVNQLVNFTTNVKTARFQPKTQNAARNVMMTLRINRVFIFFEKNYFLISRKIYFS